MRALQASRYPQCGGFATPRGSEQAENITGGDLKRNLTQRLNFAKTVRDLDKSQCGRHATASLWMGPPKHNGSALLGYKYIQGSSKL
jgi:hypothetical protein